MIIMIMMMAMAAAAAVVKVTLYVKAYSVFVYLSWI